MKGNLGYTFEKLKEPLCVKYRSTLITKTGTSFMWDNQQFDNIESAKKTVDDSISALARSLPISLTLVKEDGSEVNVSHEHTDKYFKGESPYESYKSKNP